MSHGDSVFAFTKAWRCGLPPRPFGGTVKHSWWELEYPMERIETIVNQQTRADLKTLKEGKELQIRGIGIQTKEKRTFNPGELVFMKQKCMIKLNIVQPGQENIEQRFGTRKWRWAWFKEKSWLPPYYGRWTNRKMIVRDLNRYAGPSFDFRYNESPGAEQLVNLFPCNYLCKSNKISGSEMERIAIQERLYKHNKVESERHLVCTIPRDGLFMVAAGASLSSGDHPYRCFPKENYDTDLKQWTERNKGESFDAAVGNQGGQDQECILDLNKHGDFSGTIICPQGQKEPCIEDYKPDDLLGGMYPDGNVPPDGHDKAEKQIADVVSKNKDRAEAAKAKTEPNEKPNRYEAQILKIKDGKSFTIKCDPGYITDIDTFTCQKRKVLMASMMVKQERDRALDKIGDLASSFSALPRCFKRIAVSFGGSEGSYPPTVRTGKAWAHGFFPKFTTPTGKMQAGAIVIDKRKFYKSVTKKVDENGGLLVKNKYKAGPWMVGDVAFALGHLTAQQVRDFLSENDGAAKKVYGGEFVGKLYPKDKVKETASTKLAKWTESANLAQEFARKYYEHNMEDSGETELVFRKYDAETEPDGWRTPTADGFEDLVELGEVTGYPLPDDNPNKVTVKWGWKNPDESRIVFARDASDSDTVNNPDDGTEITFLELLHANTLHQDQWSAEVTEHPVLSKLRFKLKEKGDEADGGDEPGTGKKGFASWTDKSALLQNREPQLSSERSSNSSSLSAKEVSFLDVQEGKFQFQRSGAPVDGGGSIEETTADGVSPSEPPGAMKAAGSAAEGDQKQAPNQSSQEPEAEPPAATTAPSEPEPEAEGAKAKAPQPDIVDDLDHDAILYSDLLILLPGMEPVKSLGDKYELMDDKQKDKVDAAAAASSALVAELKDDPTNLELKKALKRRQQEMMALLNDVKLAQAHHTGQSDKTVNIQALKKAHEAIDNFTQDEAESKAQFEKWGKTALARFGFKEVDQTLEMVKKNFQGAFHEGHAGSDAPSGSGGVFLSAEIDISEIQDKDERHETAKIMDDSKKSDIVGGRGVRLMEFTDPNAPDDGSKAAMTRKAYSLVRFFQVDPDAEQDETGVTLTLKPSAGGDPSPYHLLDSKFVKPFDGKGPAIFLPPYIFISRTTSTAGSRIYCPGKKM